MDVDRTSTVERISSGSAPPTPTFRQAANRRGRQVGSPDTQIASLALRASRPARVALISAAVWLVVGLGLHTGSSDAVAQASVNSADGLIMWTGCGDLPTLTDAELDAWKSKGVDGFACTFGQLKDMGGSNAFSGNAKASLGGSSYDLQRSLRDSRVVERLAARGMRAYLGFYLVNYYNTRTPLAEWFDDAGWSSTVLPRVRDVAAAARVLGFAGVAFDTELYGQTGGAETASWDWNYPGNSHTELQVRAKAKQRGQEMMTALLSEFPDIEIAAYGVLLPESWAELVQERINGLEKVYAARLEIDFWDGLTSVRGYKAIRLWDATFYKMPHLGTWESAFQYQYNKLYSYLSRRFTDWAYASSRVYVSPFAWIDAGQSDWERAREPTYVADQLRAFKKWGMGGQFANYAFGGLRGFDYGPYVAGMVSASTSETVDSQSPALTVESHPNGLASGVSSLSLEGTTADNLAIRAVGWSNGRGPL
jgi:hypothetical protein